jgi:Fe-S-cluster containining protein
MDGRSMAFVQKSARQAVADCFATGLTRDNLVRCALTELQFHEAIETSLRDAAPPERAIACTEGCSACCYQRVGCTIPEAVAIALGLTARSDDEIAAVARATRFLHDATTALDDVGRVRSGLPCAFLRDNACSIYEIRPVACRSVFSFDRAACEHFYLEFGFDQPPPHYRILLDAANQMVLGFSGALAALGLDGDLVELSSAVMLILEDPGVIDRYLAGERVFDAARPTQR